MQNLYQITIPGLSMKAGFPAARRRLLGDFPQVVEVLAMTTPSTVLGRRHRHASDAKGTPSAA
jgi:hypothetical protein